MHFTNTALRIVQEGMCNISYCDSSQNIVSYIYTKYITFFLFFVHLPACLPASFTVITM